MDKQEFDTYLENAFKYQGQMNAMANSIDLMLNVILEGIKIKPPKMLGTKIHRFEESEATLAARYSGEFGMLIDRLRKFNENWVISKHGMIVGGKRDLTFHKDNKFHTFDTKKQDEINREFTEIMCNLTEISKEI